MSGKLLMKLGKLFLVAGQTILEGRCKLYQEKNKLSSAEKLPDFEGCEDGMGDFPE